MARHLTWCLKSTFLLANRLNVNRQSIIKYSNVVVPKIFPKINKINIDYEEPKDYKTFVGESKCTMHNSINALMKTLCITKELAKKAIDEYPAFRNIQAKTIIENFQILRESAVYKSTIKDNKYILTDSTEDLKKKMIIIGKIHNDFNDTVHLFNLSLDLLEKIDTYLRMDAAYFSGSNRFQYLAEKLNREMSEICKMMSYYPTMLKLPASKLKTVTELFLDSGIAPKNILADPSAYNYNTSTIIKRIKRAQEAGIIPLKPWVLRCTEDTWNKIQEKAGRREVVLKPEQKVHEHLCEVFECDSYWTEHLILKNPKFLTMDVTKLTTMAKLLHDMGYTIDEILRSPQIFHRRMETLKELIDIWKTSGLPQPHLFIFLFGKEKFKKTLARMSSIVPKEPKSES